MEQKKKPLWWKIIKGILIVLLAIVILAAGFIGYLTITEYDPADVESVSIKDNAAKRFSGTQLTILSMNTGYAGLGEKSDFFMDGGKQVQPLNKQYVQENMSGISTILSSVDADFYLLQEVDEKSTRSYKQNQVEFYQQQLGLSSSFAKNYCCDYVPYPLPPIGTVNSGLQTLSKYEVELAERIKMPCPFSWPISIANLKRCLLISYVPIEGSDKQLVIVNLHLEAYDDGDGKIRQTQALFQVMQEEYAKGNYVIVGGDFNQNFPGVTANYPIKDPDLWLPGAFSEDDLPADWSFAFDASSPSCRLLNQPYSPSDSAMQFFVIDGFILSPNIAIDAVETLDEQFTFSDHNPVLLQITLLDGE